MRSRSSCRTSRNDTERQRTSRHSEAPCPTRTLASEADQMARWLEVITWLAGLALIAAYAALRMSASLDGARAVEVFEQRRESHPDALSKQLSSIDQSLWSPSRIDAFRRTALRETPRAVLRIPALYIQVPVYSGTDESQLDRGAGHIAGTASLDAAGLDGMKGNVGIAAHRDGFFRRLKDAARADHLHRYADANLALPCHPSSGGHAHGCLRHLSHDGSDYHARDVLPILLRRPCSAEIRCSS